MAFANELRHVIGQMSLNTFHSDYLKKIIEEYNLKGEQQNNEENCRWQKSGLQKN